MEEATRSGGCWSGRGRRGGAWRRGRSRDGAAGVRARGFVAQGRRDWGLPVLGFGGVGGVPLPAISPGGPPFAWAGGAPGRAVLTHCYVACRVSYLFQALLSEER